MGKRIINAALGDKTPMAVWREGMTNPLGD
jgi:hypothetical protein